MKFDLGFGKVLISEETNKNTGLPMLTLAHVQKEYPIGIIVEEVELPEVFDEVFIELHNLEGALVLKELLDRAISRFDISPSSILEYTQPI